MKSYQQTDGSLS